LGFIIGRLCAALKQTMDKFYVMMKEEQPNQVDAVFPAGKSARIICSISAKFLLHCSLDSLTKGKRGVCVSRHKNDKVDDARKFIAVFAFVDIAQSPIQDVSLIVSLGRILSGFNALLLRPFSLRLYSATTRRSSASLTRMSSVLRRLIGANGSQD
jgi:hypothetical protein